MCSRNPKLLKESLNNITYVINYITNSNTADIGSTHLYPYTDMKMLRVFASHIYHDKLHYCLTHINLSINDPSRVPEVKELIHSLPTVYPRYKGHVLSVLTGIKTKQFITDQYSIVVGNIPIIHCNKCKIE